MVNMIRKLKLSVVMKWPSKLSRRIYLNQTIIKKGPKDIQIPIFNRFKKHKDYSRLKIHQPIKLYHKP